MFGEVGKKKADGSSRGDHGQIKCIICMLDLAWGSIEYVWQVPSPLHNQISYISSWFQRGVYTWCFRSHKYAWSMVPSLSFHSSDNFLHIWDHGYIWGELASEGNHGPVEPCSWHDCLSILWPIVVLTIPCHLLKYSPTLSWDSTYLVNLCPDNSIWCHIFWYWALANRVGQ